MNTAATFLASGSIVFLGAFWPALRVNFDAIFAKNFLIPTLAVATINCFILSKSIGWWTLGAYPLAFIVGSILIGRLTQGKHLKTIVLDGGLWLIGIASIALSVVALFF